MSATSSAIIRRVLFGLTAFILLLSEGGRLQASEEVSPEHVSQLESWRMHFRRPASIPYPENNPYTEEKVELGRKLFFDPRLSGRGKMSCARCHNPELGLEDGFPVGEGERGLPVNRNTQTVWNLAWTQLLFWDGRVASLEEQAIHPITNPREMNTNMAEVRRRLSLDPERVHQFRKAFPGRMIITDRSIFEALATYQRSLVSPRTRFDHWVEGDDVALTSDELSGFALFTGKAGCVSCHSGWRFTDDVFRDVGLPPEDKGRGAITGKTEDLYHFKTPGLRDIARRAPYMHDGSLKTLEDVIQHHTRNFMERETVDPALKRASLTKKETSELIAFLNTLTTDTETIEDMVNDD